MEFWIFPVTKILRFCQKRFEIPLEIMYSHPSPPLPCISLSSHSSNCLSKSSTFSLTRSLHHLLQNLLSYTNALCVSFFSVSLTQAYSSWSGISGIWTFKGGHYCLSISTSLVPELCWACGVSLETSFLFFSFFSCFPWEASLWFCEKQCRTRGQLVMR